jgi:rhodanese-related sulfurtransferase
VASFADLAAQRGRPVIVLDVRRALEWADGHLEGALHIPLHELSARMGEVPPGEIWVHCLSGYRAVIAASLLQAAGREVVAVDDGYDRAAVAGLRLVTGQAAAMTA